MAPAVAVSEILHLVKELGAAIAFGVAKDESGRRIGRGASRVETKMSENIEQEDFAAALARRSDVQIAEDREERIHKCSGDPERDEIRLPGFTELHVLYEELADPSDYLARSTRSSRRYRRIAWGESVARVAARPSFDASVTLPSLETRASLSAGGTAYTGHPSRRTYCAERRSI
jgi:hypothetical protein